MWNRIDPIQRLELNSSSLIDRNKKSPMNLKDFAA